MGDEEEKPKPKIIIVPNNSLAIVFTITWIIFLIIHILRN